MNNDLAVDQRSLSPSITVSDGQRFHDYGLVTSTNTQ
jgi:hypothetical protein